MSEKWEEIEATGNSELCNCLLICCVRARRDLKAASERVGAMAVHEVYSPHLFHGAMYSHEIIESHLRYCPNNEDKP